MDERDAREYAVWLLSQQARTEKEVADRLTRKGADEATVEATLEALRRWGYLDDATLAARWVESRGKTRGRRALAFELRRKGVDNETARETLSERSDDDETAAAREAAVRKVGQHPADRSPQARKRLADHLARRGFGWSAIAPVLRELYDLDPEEIAESDDL